MKYPFQWSHTAQDADIMRNKARIIAAALVSLVLLEGGLLFNILKNGQANVTISLVGDILLSRGVEEAIKENSIENLFEGVQKKLNHSEIVLGNLECALTESGVPALKVETLLFKTDPIHAKALCNAGFSILNLANNHSMDYGSEGISSTISALDECGIASLGAGADKTQANQPVFIKKEGIVFGFLGFSDFPADGYFTFSDRADVTFVDRKTLANRVHSAKEECNFLIVSFHWGEEFAPDCDDMQKELAHLAADSGADLIVGHHPHVLQGVEKYGDSYIFYSLGNFVFDKLEPAGTDETVICDVIFDSDGVQSIAFIPMEIVDCKPQPVYGDKAQNILTRLQELSESLGTDIVINGGVGYVEP